MRIRVVLESAAIMKRIIFIFLLCSLSAFAGAQTIADTTKINFFDVVKSWNGTCATLKAYMFPSQTGNSGKYLTTDGTSMSWGTVTGGSGDVATDAIWDAKGDLAVGTGANTAAKLSVGTDGKSLYADADETTGLRWGPSIISPSQLTADQDDWNPSGFDEAQVVRIDGDNGIRAITSMVATFGGDTKTLSNVGSYPVYFPGEHPDGTAANRFALRGDYILLPGASADVWYDGTSSRWRFKTAQGALNDANGLLYSTSYGSQTAGDWGNITLVTSGGSITGTDAASGIPGHWLFSSTTSSTGAAYIYYPKTSTQASIFGDAHLSTEVTVSVPVLSETSERFWVYLTLDDATTTTSTSGAANNNTVGIRYYHGINSGKWELFTKNSGGTESTADSGVTVTADVPYTLRCEIDKAKTEVRYYINGAYVGRITTNLPNANTCSPRIWLQKTAGTTARTLRVQRFFFQAIYP